MYAPIFLFFLNAQWKTSLHAKCIVAITFAIGNPNRRFENFVWQLNYCPNSSHKTYYQITLAKELRQNQKPSSDRQMLFFFSFLGEIVKSTFLSGMSHFINCPCYDLNKKGWLYSSV